MRTILAMATLLVSTLVLGTLVIVAAALGIRDRAGGIFDLAPRWWSNALLRASGVRVRLHRRADTPDDGDARIYVCNHVSWYDPPAVASVLPRCKFVAKQEIFRVPVFGRGARAVGTIPIARDNRKAAFEAYRVAGEAIRDGASVVVFPEGTRGATYALRSFKKGPFVLAIASGVPVVPTLIHGTIAVNPRGSMRAHAGDVDVHLLEPIPTAGLTYEDRDRLSRLVRQRMADAMAELYGVASEAEPAEARGAA